MHGRCGGGGGGSGGGGVEDNVSGVVSDMGVRSPAGVMRDEVMPTGEIAGVFRNEEVNVEDGEAIGEDPEDNANGVDEEDDNILETGSTEEDGMKKNNEKDGNDEDAEADDNSVRDKVNDDLEEIKDDKEEENDGNGSDGEKVEDNVEELQEDEDKEEGEDDKEEDRIVVAAGLP